MRVTKFGHSCLLIQESGVQIVIDPGTFSDRQNDVTDIDAVLITHEHPDHLDPVSIKKILANNPSATLFTNTGTGAALENEGIPFSILSGGESVSVQGVSIQGIGVDHACIHDAIPVIRNTGYFIAGRLFYPGDALSVFPEGVEILALPVAAPWMKLSDTIEYAIRLKPKVVFPVHDGMLRPDRVGSTRAVSKVVLEPVGIEFRDMVEGSVEEF